MTRKSLVTDVSSAVDRISNGDTLGIGGILTSHKPMACIREIVRRGISDLTVVVPPTSLETDLLIASGCVDTVIAPYVGAETVAPIAPWFRREVERDRITVKESDAGMILAALEAADRNLPFMPWRGGVGTDIPSLNEDLVVFTDPIEEERLVAVPAIEPDVGLLHLPRADKFGNVQAVGDTLVSALLARASKTTYVQVEEFVANEEVRRTPELTVASFGAVDGVIEVPWGAHPFSCQGYYHADREFLEEYVSAADHGDDDRTWESFFARYVTDPNSHGEYLESVGLDHLTGLSEYGVSSDE